MKNYFSSAFAVTDIIINYYKSKKMRLSKLRLQHLLYRMYEDFYEKYGEILFPENFYATVKGPEIKEIDICYGDDDLDFVSSKNYSDEEVAILVPLLIKYDDTLISEFVFCNCGENSPYLAVGGYDNDNEKLIPSNLITECIDMGKKQINLLRCTSDFTHRATEALKSVIGIEGHDFTLKVSKEIAEPYRPKYKSPFKISYARFGMISESAMNNILDLDLTGIDFKILFLMLAETQPITGSVCLSDGKPVTKDWICSKINKSEKTVRYSLKALEEKELIKKMDDNNCVKYYVNPYVFIKNRKINGYLYNMFKDTVWHKEHLEKIQFSKQLD